MKGLVVFVGMILIIGSVGSASTSFADWTCLRTKDGVVVEGVAAEGNGTLLVRCAAGKPTLFLKWRDYRGSLPILIRAQLDRSDPVEGWWPRAVGRREVQYPGDQASFLRGLQTSETLAIRLSPEGVPSADASVDGTSDNPPQTVPGSVNLPLQMTFRLSGLARALAAAQGSCGPL